MSGSVEKTNPRKRPRDVDVETPNKRLDKDSGYHKVAREYVAPTAEKMQEIRAQFAHPSFTGLNPFKLDDQPHPLTGRRNENENEFMQLVTSEILECKDSQILKPENNADAGDTEGLTTRAGQVIYVINHDLNERDIMHYIVPHNKWSELLERSTVKRMRRLVTERQSDAFKFFLKVVKTARQHFDPDQFAYSTLALQVPIWKRIWEQAPMSCTEEMLGVCARHIDLKTIFYSQNDDETKKRWRDIFRRVFVLGCHFLVKHCPGETDQVKSVGRAIWYNEWKSMTVPSNWSTVGGDLWCLDKLPVLADPYPRGRKQSERMQSHAESDDDIDGSNEAA